MSNEAAIAVVMQPGSSVAEVSAVLRAAESLGLAPTLSNKVIGVIGAADAGQFAMLPGVERVVPVSTAFKRTSRALHPEASVVRVGNAQIGGGAFTVIAGPCAVESLDQLLAAAELAKRAGATILRGGAFKPRTSPYAFRGLGRQGLELLAEARRRTGLPVVTEVMAPEDVPIVAEFADALQVGARNMQNFNLLEACGRQSKPVLLKRGLSSTIEELLLSAEYVVSQGNRDVILCERGIRTFEKATRNTLDISAVPVVKKLSHLPIIVDPSHAAGVREYVPALSLAAVAAGADGLLAEIHPEPEKALCDGPQSLALADFEALMPKLRAVAAALGREIAS